MTSYWVTVQCRQTEFLRDNQLFTQPTFACDRFFPVHFRSDILSKPFFFHPLLGTIHPDSFVRDLISGQSIDRYSHSRNQVSSPRVEFCLLSSRPLRSLFTFGYTRTSSTRTRTRPLPEFSASLPLRLLIWLCPAVSLLAHHFGRHTSNIRILHLRVLKVDYEMCLQVMENNPLSSRHRRYRPV